MSATLTAAELNLLAEPLRPEHVKPRLLGHWGTTPGLNLIYAHLNRVIGNWEPERDLSRRSQHGRQYLPRGDKYRAVPGDYPGRILARARPRGGV